MWFPQESEDIPNWRRLFDFQWRALNPKGSFLMLRAMLFLDVQSRVRHSKSDPVLVIPFTHIGRQDGSRMNIQNGSGRRKGCLCETLERYSKANPWFMDSYFKAKNSFSTVGNQHKTMSLFYGWKTLFKVTCLYQVNTKLSFGQEVWYCPKVGTLEVLEDSICSQADIRGLGQFRDFRVPACCLD